MGGAAGPKRQGACAQTGARALRVGDTRMPDLNFEQMMWIRRETAGALHAGEWDTLTPEVGRSQLLWMVKEVGEVIAIFKKKRRPSHHGGPRGAAAFLEEMGDVIMYFTDVLL